MSNNNPFLQQPAQNLYGPFTRFVSSEQEAINAQMVGNQTNFFVDGENLVLYAKYADGRPMETFDLVLREPPKQPEYVTVEDLHSYLDQKFEEFGKKFQLRKDYNNRGGQNNGQ